METAYPAPWESRFWAWLIDMLLVGLFCGMFRGCPVIAQSLGIAGSPGIEVLGIGLALFTYWTVLEGYRGQSIGKMVMNIAVVEVSGDMVGYEKAAIECFGKAFLLPMDCFIGWLVGPASCQRLFNRASGTLVVAIDLEDKSLQGVQIGSRAS